MSAGGLPCAPVGCATTRVVRRLGTLRDEGGFTLIEVLVAAMMLVIISAPIGAMLSSGATTARTARERTGADQLMQQQIELLRSTPYTSVGVANGNPPGSLAALTDTALPSGEQVRITFVVTWVSDKVPENPYQTNADYKKVVITILRRPDMTVLDQTTTYVAAATAPPSAGTTWVQVKRTVQDAVTALAIVGANVNLTGGPKSENRNDTTDASGGVLFPALSSGGATPYTLVTTYTGYSVFPDDISPATPSSIPATPGLNSIATIRMYKGTSLTINLQTSGGAAYTSGATLSVDSSRCGSASIVVPSGQSSVTVTTCNPWGTTSVLLPPNVSGQTPDDSKYYVTAWSTDTTAGNWSTGTAVTVPTGYPTTLTASVTVKMVSATFKSNASPSQQKQVKVTVMKGGSADTNARVELTGAPTGISPGIALFATTNGSGQATFTVPVVSASTTFTASANDRGVQKGTNTVSVNTGTTSPANVTVTIS